MMTVLTRDTRFPSTGVRSIYRASNTMKYLTGVDASPCRDHDYVTMCRRRVDYVL